MRSCFLKKETRVKFKNDRARFEFAKAPFKLREICLDLDAVSQKKFKIETVCTRVKEPVANESGVHPAGRAVDFRDEYMIDSEKTERLYLPEQVQYLVDYLNEKYPRTDRKSVAIHHAVEGGMDHFHIQIPYAWLLPHERKGD